MSNLILPENHFLYTTYQEVGRICQSLYNNFEIKDFNYYRVYKEGFFYGLINGNLLLIKHHLKKGYIVTPNISKKVKEKNFIYIPTPDLDDGYSQVVKDYQELFNVFNGLCLFERHEDYFDLFGFLYTGPKSNAVQYYFSNMYDLENFKEYFKEKALYLIHEAANHKILLPDTMRPNAHSFLFSNNLETKNTNGLDQVRLTKREVECVKYLLTGMTIKKIAAQLNRSPRTIESQIENVKRKTKSLNKYDLVQKLKSKWYF